MPEIPPAILDLLRPGAKTKVAVDVQGGQPEARPRYLLDDLLAQCDKDVASSAEDRAWVDAGPIGDELL